MHKVGMKKPAAVSKRVLRNEINRYKMGEELARHMGFIYVIVLYDKMGMSFKKLDNCLNKTYHIMQQWRDSSNTEVTSEKLLKYSIKKKLKTYEAMKSIPASDKLHLANINRGAYGALDSVESALLVTMLVISTVLKESYRYSNQKMNEFYSWVKYAIKMYNTKLPKEPGYVFSDRYIRDCILEDEGFDLFNSNLQKESKNERT